MNLSCGYDASNQVYQILAMLFGDIDFFKHCNVEGDIYSDVYMYIKREINIGDRIKHVNKDGSIEYIKITPRLKA